jgi:hypothetical protein
MGDLSMFIPITKVDAVQRLVYGVATAEVEDRAGEICDYASTKPHYEQWSDEIAQSTGGKSLGNLRAMHGPVAAGKVTAITFNDEEKQIEICAKVVDDSEWIKVTEGVYTGFSQGGAYERRWTDAAGLTRYTAVPSEISLVDLPCLPQARFEMIKLDGTREMRGFEPHLDVTARLDELAANLDWLLSLSSDDLVEVPYVSCVIDELQGLSERLVNVLRLLESDQTISRGEADRKSRRKIDPARRAGKVATDAMFRDGGRNHRDLPRSRHDPIDDDNEYAPTTDSTRWGIEKRFDRLAAMLADVLRRIKNIEQQPLPLPLSGAQRPIAKHEDGVQDLHQATTIDSLLGNPEALSILAIRLAQRNGRAPLR